MYTLNKHERPNNQIVNMDADFDDLIADCVNDHMEDTTFDILMDDRTRIDSHEITKQMLESRLSDCAHYLDVFMSSQDDGEIDLIKGKSIRLYKETITSMLWEQINFHHNFPAKYDCHIDDCLHTQTEDF